MKKSDSIILYQSLLPKYRDNLGNERLGLLSNLKGAKFVYGLDRNLTLLKPEIESLEKASAPSEEYLKFEKEIRIPMVEGFAKKDEKGKSE